MKSFILILAAFLLTAVHSIPSPAWVWIPEGAPPPPSTPPTTQENTSPETTSKLILVSANRNEYRLARASFSGDFAASKLSFSLAITYPLISKYFNFFQYLLEYTHSFRFINTIFV